jgi:hypothetical protein
MVSKGLTGWVWAGYWGADGSPPPVRPSLRAQRSNPSIPARRGGLLRSARNDGERTHLYLPAARFARVLQIVSPKQEGAGNAGCLLHPRSRVQEMVSDAHTSIQVQPEHSGIPRAMVLRLMARSPRRRIPFASVIGELTALANPVGFAGASADLTPATGARTTRFCRTLQHRSSAAPPNRSQAKARPAIRLKRSGRCRVHRIPTHVRDDRDTPLLAGRNG